MTIEMKWRPARGVKVPEYEVLAVDYNNNIYLGFLGKNETGWFCNDGTGPNVENVTYYFPIRELRRTIPKGK